MKYTKECLTVFVVCLSLGVCFSSCNMKKVYLVVTSILQGSGAPPKTEREAIKKREQEFYQTGKDQDIMVYAVYRFKDGKDCVRNEASNCLENQLRNLDFNQVKRFSDPVNLPFTPQPNEMAIFWERAKAFSKTIQELTIEADTILMLDIFASWQKDSVHAVHAVGCNAQGKIKYLGFWNSHQSLYKELKPKTEDDALNILVTDLKRKLQLN